MNLKEDKQQRVRFNFILFSLIYQFQGIWMCKALDIPLLVMDVEGTDGRERGEDQVSIPYSINHILIYYI